MNHRGIPLIVLVLCLGCGSGCGGTPPQGSNRAVEPTDVDYRPTGSGSSGIGATGTGPGEDSALIVEPETTEIPGEIRTLADLELDVQVAATERTRSRGFMFRETIGEREGILFVFPNPELHGFWMKDCKAPIDIAYIDELFRIVDIHTMTPEAETVPLTEYRRYLSSEPTPYALQAKGGWFSEHGLKAGDRIDLTPTISGVVPE